MSRDLPGLRSIPLFDGLSPETLRNLRNHLRRIRLAPGVRLFSEGERGASCYLVLEGAVEVFKDVPDQPTQLLARLGAGDLVGHLALIDYRPRSATCRAGAEGATLLEVDRPEFDRLFLARSPFTYKLLDRIALDLAARLRGATRQLVETHAERPGRRRLTADRVARDPGPHAATLDLAGLDLARISVEVPSEIELTQRTPGSEGHE